MNSHVFSHLYKGRLHRYLLVLFVFLVHTSLHGNVSYYYNKLLNKLGQEAKSEIESSNIKRKKKLKILFVETYFPAKTSTAVLNQITALIDHGHDIYIHAQAHGDMAWAHPDIKKYNLMKRVYFKKIPYDIKTFDIIFCQFGYRATEWLKIKRQYNLKSQLITCFRGADLSRNIKNNPHMYDALFRAGALFLPVCDYFKNRLIKLGCKPQKIITLYSAIDADRFKYIDSAHKRSDDSIITISSVSRLTEKKGLKYTIEAVARLVEKYKNIRYYIVGFGGLEDDLRSLIKRLHMQDHIIMLGRASQDEVAKLLAKTDIFLSPSITAKNGDQEGIANAAKEAMACGIPVIATYHAGTKELVQDGETGFLLQEKDVDGLVEKMEYVIENPEHAHQMGAAGRQIIEKKFDKKVLSKKLAEIFKDKFMIKRTEVVDCQNLYDI